MEYTNKPFAVYVKVDDNGRIVAINSDAYITNFEGWQKVSEGYDDRHHHAQGNHLPLSLMDDNGAYRYKLEDGRPVERTAEEMAADVQENAQEDQEEQVKPTHEERIADLEEALEMLLSGVTE